MSDDLKPCPFCGGEASGDGFQKLRTPHKETRWDDGSEITEAYFCNCIKCGASNIVCSIRYRTKAEAIAAWNRRAAQPEMSALVEALRKISEEVSYPPGFDRDPEPTRAAKVARAALTEWESANAR